MSWGPAYGSETDRVDAARSLLADLDRLAGAQEAAVAADDFTLLEGLQDASDLILADLSRLQPGLSARSAASLRAAGQSIHHRYRTLAQRLAAGRDRVAEVLSQIRVSEQYDRLATPRGGVPDLVDVTG